MYRNLTSETYFRFLLYKLHITIRDSFYLKIQKLITDLSNFLSGLVMNGPWPGSCCHRKIWPWTYRRQSISGEDLILLSVIWEVSFVSCDIMKQCSVAACCERRSTWRRLWIYLKYFYYISSLYCIKKKEEKKKKKKSYQQTC